MEGNGEAEEDKEGSRELCGEYERERELTRDGESEEEEDMREEKELEEITSDQKERRQIDPRETPDHDQSSVPLLLIHDRTDVVRATVDTDRRHPRRRKKLVESQLPLERDPQ